MHIKFAAALASTFLALSGLAVAQDTLPDPDPGHDNARQERMNEAYQEHLHHSSSSSMESPRPGAAERFEDATKRDAHKTGQAIKRGAHKTGDAIERGVDKVKSKAHSSSEPS